MNEINLAYKRHELSKYKLKKFCYTDLILGVCDINFIKPKKIINKIKINK